MYLAGYQASALEHYVLDALTNTESISAARGLQVATAAPTNQVFKLKKSGSIYVDLFTQTTKNVGTTLLLDPTLEADIIALLDNGYVITVAQKPVTLNSWTGPVFMKAKTSASGFEFASLVDGDGEFIGGGQITSSTPASILPTVANTESIVTFAGDKVNLANGNLFRDDLDLSLQNIGYPIMFQRHYDSESTDDFGMGVGWRYSFGDKLELDLANNKAKWITSSGTEHTFTRTSTNPETWSVPPSLLGATLTKAGTDYVITEKNGLKHTFDLTGKLAAIDDRNGNRLRIVYDVVGGDYIRRIRDLSSGTAVTRLELIDVGNNGHIDVVEDHTGREWTYQYTTDGANQYLTRVDSPSDSTTEARTFEYDYFIGGAAGLTGAAEGRAGASKSGVGEDCQEVAGVEGALQALVLDAAFVRLLLSQQAECQATHGGEVGRAVAVLLAA